MKCQLVLGVVPPCTEMGKIEALAVTRGSLRPTCWELQAHDSGAMG